MAKKTIDNIIREEVKKVLKEEFSSNDIYWSGDNGRTPDGREFRRSSGKIYQMVNGKWELVNDQLLNAKTSKAEGYQSPDINKIYWNGNNGRTLDGKIYKRMNNKVYQRVGEEWLPVQTPAAPVQATNDATAQIQEAKLRKLIRENINKVLGKK